MAYDMRIIDWSSYVCSSDLQARHRRAVEVDRAGHGALPRALELRVALRLEPDDRHHPDPDRGREGAGGAPAGDGTGKDRAAGRPTGREPGRVRGCREV